MQVYTTEGSKVFSLMVHLGTLLEGPVRTTTLVVKHISSHYKCTSRALSLVAFIVHGTDAILCDCRGEDKEDEGAGEGDSEGDGKFVRCVTGF